MHEDGYVSLTAVLMHYIETIILLSRSSVYVWLFERGTLPSSHGAV